MLLTRGILYTAMTRAKESLTITYAKQRMLYGRTTVNHRSRFVDEIPKTISGKIKRAELRHRDSLRFDS